MKKIYILLISAALLMSGCSDKESDEGPSTEKVNKYIYEMMGTWYLWNQEMPSVDPTKYSSPNALFEAMRNVNDRNWSKLSNKANSFIDSFQNAGTSLGYQLAFFRLGNTTQLFAIVEFVYKDSPAYDANLRRGNPIIKINGDYITEDNYLQLYTSSELDLGIGMIVDGTLHDIDKTIKLKARAASLDPIIHSSIINTGNKRVGYLFYSDFTTSSEEDLVALFRDKFLGQVDEFVLDLRCNGGGSSSTAELLASILAPKEYVQAKKPLYSDTYNTIITQAFKDQGVYQSYTQHTFDPNVKVNMDLKRLYVLTSGNTASASELTILGLKPYMDVITIGATTHGKYCGGMILPSPKSSNGILHHDSSIIGNWAMYLITFRYANSAGEPAFNENQGIYPDYSKNDSYLHSLGSVYDPLLAQALQQIDMSYSPAPAKAPDKELPAMEQIEYVRAPGRPGNLIMN